MTLHRFRPESRALQDNPCSDPTVRDLWVYTPPGYEESDRRYPVLWCLTGFTGTGAMALAGNRWAPGVPARMDRFIEQGSPPAIVAFPDCFTRWGGSQYVNSAALGRYEDYLCDELVPLVDAELRTSPERGARGVFGKSSGGYGALRLGMRRPELFGALACHSGDMGFEFCYVPDFAPCAARIAAVGSLEKWVEQFESCEKKRPEDHCVINTLAMAAAYSPDADAPLGIRLPFDLETAEVDAETWSRWKENDPVEMVRRPECAEALESMALVFLDCGCNDEYRLHMGLRLFRRRLKELGIEAVIEEFEDNHRMIGYRYEVSLPLLLRALGD